MEADRFEVLPSRGITPSIEDRSVEHADKKMVRRARTTKGGSFSSWIRSGATASMNEFSSARHKENSATLKSLKQRMDEVYRFEAPVLYGIEQIHTKFRRSTERETAKLNVLKDLRSISIIPAHARDDGK